MLVVSDIFVNNVVSGFGGAVQGRAPTTYGTVLQGIMLVLFYIVATYAADHNII